MQPRAPGISSQFEGTANPARPVRGYAYTITRSPRDLRQIDGAVLGGMQRNAREPHARQMIAGAVIQRDRQIRRQVHEVSQCVGPWQAGRRPSQSRDFAASSRFIIDRRESTPGFRHAATRAPGSSTACSCHSIRMWNGGSRSGDLRTSSGRCFAEARRQSGGHHRDQIGFRHDVGHREKVRRGGQQAAAQAMTCQDIIDQPAAVGAIEDGHVAGGRELAQR